MNDHVLLNLLNKLGKNDKMRGLSNVLSLLRNEFDQFNNTGARMFDSVYHVTLKLFCYRIFGVKMPRICNLLRNVIMDVKVLRY